MEEDVGGLEQNVPIPPRGQPPHVVAGVRQLALFGELGLVEERPAKVGKPLAGHYKKAGVPPTRVRREVKQTAGAEAPPSPCRGAACTETGPASPNGPKQNPLRTDFSPDLPKGWTNEAQWARPGPAGDQVERERGDDVGDVVLEPRRDGGCIDAGDRFGGAHRPAT